MCCCGLLKQFVKALSNERDCFEYLISKFSNLSFEKIIAVTFDDTQIRQLISDEHHRNNNRTRKEFIGWHSNIFLTMRVENSRKIVL